MKIGFVINGLGGGGAERSLLLHARFLKEERGHDVCIFTLHRSSPAYPIPAGVSVVPLKVGPTGPASAPALVPQAMELASLFSRQQIDIGIGYLLRANAALVASRGFGNPSAIAVSEHIDTSHYDRRKIKDRILLSLMKATYSRADRIIAVSKPIAESMTALVGRPHKTVVVHNPADSSFFATENRSLPQTPAVIVAMGRLIDFKDFPTLLRAFSLLDSTRGTRLIVAGEGERRKQLEELSIELGIANNVEFRGWVADPNALFREGHVFILSSKYEGFGMVIVEALAAGLPVISTNCPSGPEEILQSGKAGILVPVAQPDALAKAISSLLSDPVLYRELSEAGRRRAADFAVSRTGTALEAVLSETLDAHRTRL